MQNHAQYCVHDSFSAEQDQADIGRKQQDPSMSLEHPKFSSTKALSLSHSIIKDVS